MGVQAAMVDVGEIPLGTDPSRPLPLPSSFSPSPSPSPTPPAGVASQTCDGHGSSRYDGWNPEIKARPSGLPAYLPE